MYFSFKNGNELPRVMLSCTRTVPDFFLKLPKNLEKVNFELKSHKLFTKNSRKFQIKPWLCPENNLSASTEYEILLRLDSV